MTAVRRSWMVDSVEEGIAAVEEDGGRILRLPLWLLPEGVREGEILAVLREGDTNRGSVLIVRVDREATERALRRSRVRMGQAPPGNDPGGPIVL
ncbi:MAG TPA: DUF3006 domain-containing protein [Longimicrobiaceae bacterium]|nr:DUF3006 domain-containing protein [Longimicrobiaceae bacterium]